MKPSFLAVFVAGVSVCGARLGIFVAKWLSAGAPTT